MQQKCLVQSNLSTSGTLKLMILKQNLYLRHRIPESENIQALCIISKGLSNCFKKKEKKKHGSPQLLWFLLNPLNRPITIKI